MQCPHCDAVLPSDAKFCAACGRALPPPAPTRFGAPPWAILVVVAVGGIVLLAVLGIIAAIAIPAFLAAADQAKQEQTMNDLQAIGAAIELYREDKHAYPKATNLGHLRSELVPQYTKTMPTLDAWDNRFQVLACGGEHCVVGSPGKDGVLNQCRNDRPKDFADDLCFMDGKFTPLRN